MMIILLPPRQSLLKQEAHKDSLCSGKKKTKHLNTASKHCNS